MTKPEMVPKAADTVEITVNQSKQRSPPPWQRVPNSYKRKRTSESPPNPTSVAVSNRFTSLPIDQPESENNNTSYLGNKFISGGDWNAKHTYWGSRISLPRGRSLKSCLDTHHLTPISTGEPTSWPADRNKSPDLLDFFVTKGVSHLYTSVESSLDGSSDHTPVILTLSTSVIHVEQTDALYNHKTDWQGFRSFLEENIKLNISMKTPEDVDNACESFTNLIQVSSWKNSPCITYPPLTASQSTVIKTKLLEKRRLRRIWQQSHHPTDKTAFNKSAKQLKQLLLDSANSSFRNTIERMSPQGKGDASLWKAIKTNKRPQEHLHPIKSSNSWARTDAEKAEAFANHLENVFKPNDGSDEPDVIDILSQDLQLCLPLKPASPKEIAREIRRLNSNKAPGFDLITPKHLKNLPRKCITFLASLFNAILRLSYFPKIWKISEIIMIHKPGKSPHEAASYRPISLTPVLSKLWEKIFVVRLMEHMDNCDLVPSHQFGFRKQHSTIEQMHRVHQEIRRCFEMNQYCSAAFLDVQQAFDRVWHKGLLCKVKDKLPHSLFPIIQSYLEGRLFRVKQRDDRSSLRQIHAGVPQGSVLGPVLYSLFTADLPVASDVTVATYADDVAYLVRDDIPIAASNKLQRLLDATCEWMRKWRIRASAQKSHHITFTLRRGNCPPVKFGDDVLTDSEHVKYLGFNLDRRLTWATHIKKKRDEINFKFRNLYWLMGRNSVLSVDNKLLIYNTVLKPIWTYGVPLWGTASKSNIMCIQRIQNHILRTITSAPWFYQKCGDP
ncbi:unnamed protein product [Colias eurytheme]|nr:unnamed protein product [Colias eurytheme]